MKDKLKSLLKNSDKQKIILRYLIRLYVLGVFITNILKTLGCIGFWSHQMQDTYYACGLFLACIFIYECYGIDEAEKNLLIGVLMGSIASVYDERFFCLSLVFAINIIWTKVTVGEGCWSTIYKIVRITFFCMTTLEIYSICTVANEYLLERRTSTSFLFNFMDLFFVISTILFLVCKNDVNLKVDSEEDISRKKFYAQCTKLCVWCVMVLALLLMMMSTIYVTGKSNMTGESFFFGKSIDRGYLISGNEENTQEYFIQRVEENNDVKIGNVVENPAAYNYIELGNQLTFQVMALYIGKFICLLQYGRGSIIVMAVGVMVFLLYKINRFDKC